MQDITPILTVAIAMIAIVLFGVFFLYFPIWIRALVAGAPLPLTKIVSLRLKRIPLDVMIDAHIRTVKAGLTIPIDKFETHHLAGGNVERLCLAVIASHVAKLGFTFEQLAAIDFAGNDPFEFIKKQVGAK